MHNDDAHGFVYAKELSWTYSSNSPSYRWDLRKYLHHQCCCCNHSVLLFQFILSDGFRSSVKIDFLVLLYTFFLSIMRTCIWKDCIISVVELLINYFINIVNGTWSMSAHLFVYTTFCITTIYQNPSTILARLQFRLSYFLIKYIVLIQVSMK